MTEKDDHVRDAISVLEWGTFGHCIVCREFHRGYDGTHVRPGLHKPDCIIGLAVQQLRAEGRWGGWEYK